MNTAKRSPQKNWTTPKTLPLAITLGIVALTLNGCVSVPSLDQSETTETSQIQKTVSVQTTQSYNPITRPQAQKPSTLHLSEKPQIKQEIEAQYQHLETVQSDNLWDTFAGSFQLVIKNEGHFEHSVSFYQKRQKHLIEVSKRAKPYLYYIVQEVKARNMPMEIALLPIVESGFKAHAKSHAKALGLWQFMPATGKSLGLENNWWYDGRRDVVKSTEAALTYLQRHYNNTNDWLLALASYNAGYGNVLKAIKRYQKKHSKSETLPTFWQISKYLPRETQNYVPSLLSIAYLIEHNDKYNIDIAPIANKPFFDVIELNNQISLNAVAANTKVSPSLLAQLNPAYIRQATPPNGPHHILLPVDKEPLFTQFYEQNAKNFEVHWQRHKIRAGDYLGKIAENYGTSVSAIKKLNKMRSNFIRVGQTLLIPVVADSTNLVKVNTVSPTEALRSSSRDHASSKVAKAPAKSVSTRLLYKVQAGDTLSEIAERNGVDVQQIRDWNKMGKKSTIRVGQNLVLDQNAIQNQKLVHKVKSGETLSEIAYQHGVKVKQLMQWNSISSAKSLKPNQELNIWLGSNTSKHKQYIVRNGDNLWVIAKEFELSVDGLAKYNQITKKTLLRPGQILKIPFKTI
ncbi:LysM peptidoglycan-binding domain-containing protein [Thiomicrorhabdus sp. 6S2-11]|uniref:LysM peptidoglycan-binding domain-containing protein n=1 Tax=Thiomicrorhabdus marina TaxID=2818442 RepID=A0ABS3Q213_9GAMM|nr:LysM peptidoglycan-binding domain-containing protein [Thiomicrorhabdus marina]MBO1926004.1 LysM peptidoglycan-binding domain-containing protein [Thiomicrorhabdus marina]